MGSLRSNQAPSHPNPLPEAERGSKAKTPPRKVPTPVPDASPSEPGPAAPPDVVGADFTPATGGDRAAGAGDPYLQDSVEAERLYALAVSEAAAGNEEHAVPYFLRASKHAEASREWYLTAVSCRQAADMFRSPEPPFDLERAFRLYRRAVAAYELCGHYAEARDLSYDVMRLKLRSGRALGLPWWLRFELFLFWLVAGFGYRPGRVLVSALGIVFAFAVFFHLTGGVEPGRDGKPVGFVECFYFSGITFSTVGYGDFLPAPHVRYVAMAEGATGAFAMSFFVIVLANRLRH